MKRLMKKSKFNRTAGWIQLDRDRPMAVNRTWGKGDNTKDTWFQQGILSLDTLDNAVGYNNEQRQWVDNGDGTRSFGNYSEEKWNKFLEDIRTNGITEPIVLEVWTDGTIKIWEGNHRIEACRQLGITEIPAKVFYKGQSQEDYKIT